MPLTHEIIEGAVDRYWREFDRYAKLSEFVGEACRKLLDLNVIRGSVQWRAKNPDRLRAKLEKWMASGDHAGELESVDSVFTVLKDLAGARITTYVESDRDKVVESLVKRFSGVGSAAAVVPDKKDEAGKFYRATHCVVSLKDDDLVGRYQNLKGLGCEVQVCSLLAHVYNEVEHDLRYKPLAGNLSGREVSFLDGLGHLVATGDIVINQTLEAVEERQKENKEAFEDEYDFVARMRGLFPAATNFATYAGQLYEACLKLGLNSPDKIRTALNWQEGATSAQGLQLAQAVAAFIQGHGQVQLEVDPSSSDQLAVLLLNDQGRVSQLRELYPAGRGVGRATRLMSLAKQVQEMNTPAAQGAAQLAANPGA
ncbi:MAG: GTP pyrophosphokinase [Chthoniobacteraceae bacterium]